MLAFTSYLFTWQQDQDKVLQFSWGIFMEPSIPIENWLGRLGAVISHMFFYWGPGLASFFLVGIFGKLGVTLLKHAPLQPFWKFAKVSVLALVFSAISLEFVLHSQPFPWGGAFGESTYIWLSNFLGNAGLFLLLLFFAAAFVIWVFNPKLSNFGRIPNFDINLPQMPSFKGLIPKYVPSTQEASSSGTATETRKKKEVSPVAESRPAQAVKDEPVEEVIDNTLKPNFLESFKEKGDSLDFDLSEETTEKVEEPVVEDELEFDISAPKKPKPIPVDNTTLEINAPEGQPVVESVGGEEVDDTAALKVNIHSNHDPGVSHAELDNIDHSEPYDPKADLSRYEAPSPELLEDYSEHKVEIDRAELEANKDQIIETLLNYKIEITKIRATIGPTVTLYEIIPAWPFYSKID